MKTSFLLLILFPLLALSDNFYSDSDRAGLDAYYIVMSLENGRLEILDVRVVQILNHLESASIDEIAELMKHPSQSTNSYLVRVLDSTEKLFFQSILKPSKMLRGEFHKNQTSQSKLGESNIESRLIPLDKETLVVRIPIVDDSVLTIQAADGPTVQTFQMEEVKTKAKRVPNALLQGGLIPWAEIMKHSRAIAINPFPGWLNGSVENRYDLLIMGDGYQLAEKAKFTSHAQNLVSNFFSLPVYKEYKGYFNVWTHFVASSDSGADQPAFTANCIPPDPAVRQFTCCNDAAANGLTGESVDTAFDGTFCSYNVQRLVTTNDDKVLLAAAAVPDWDAIMVIINDDQYGGSGGNLSVITHHDRSAEVAQHEFLHTFANFADEYDDHYTYPGCSDLAGTTPCEANVTDVKDQDDIKWRHWIASATAIPTTTAPTNPESAGLWEGARYKTTGMFRQGYSCIMRDLGSPFCEVDGEAALVRLHKGGWGAPVNGIDNIEPGSESHPAGLIHLMADDAAISARLLGPTGTNVLRVEWRLNGMLVSSSTAKSGDTTTFSVNQPAGMYPLSLTVTDIAGFVHESVRGSIASQRQWLLEISN